jgi:hypothetical protein
MKSKNRTFRWRAFISFLLLFSFLLSALSGVLLFARPEGSLAAWTAWSALGLDKKQWEGVHVVSVFLFFFSVLVHLVFNWRALTAYCRRRKEQAGTSFKNPGRWREFSAAALLAVLLLIATLLKWAPAQWLVDLRGAYKSGSPYVAATPPSADADKLSLAKLCPLLGIDEAQLLAAARRSHIRVESLAQTLAEGAMANSTTPEKVFILLKTK